MLNIQLAKKYAAAIFEVAQEENDLAKCDNDLQQIDTLFTQNNDLKAFLENPQVAINAKKDLTSKILAGEFEQSVSNFIFLLIDKRRISLLPAIITSFHALANEAQNIQTAYVKTAKALTKEQKDALIDKLENITEKTIKLKTNIDPAIIGGVIIKIGDRVIDGSVTSQIKSIQKQLIANC